MADDAPHSIETVAAGAGPLETTCEWLSCVALLAMIGLIGAEAIVRNLFGASLQITDELCGYLLVAVTFLSVSVSEARGAFHRVELVLARMPWRARTGLQIAFDLASLAATAAVTWQLGRLAMNSWRAEDVAPTPLQTPLWIPQSVMVFGMGVLCVALLRSMRAKARYLGGPGPGGGPPSREPAA